MAQIAVGIKFFIVMLYHGGISLVANSIISSSLNGGVLDAWQMFSLIFFILMMVFLPEIMFITWPFFRKFIMEGIQDGDGITHAKDIKQLIILYVSLWCMRLFMAFGIAKMFGKDIDNITFLLPLLGSFGTAGLAIIKDILKRG